MRLRYAGTCRGCAIALPAGHPAVYFRVDKQVECTDCFEQAAPAIVLAQPDGDPPLNTVLTTAESVDELPADDLPSQTVETEPTSEVVVASGTAGASARREHERRVAKREARIRAAHPRLGGLILAVSDEPQSTRAWERGAIGEEKLARSLDSLVERGARVLHDRRIPGSRANIDHIVVAPAGVFVVDAKRYKGRPHLRVDGGILRPRVEKLMVGSRDCSKLITGIQKQIELVNSALEAAEVTDIPAARGMLCYVDADWPLFGGAFETSGIEILWPKKIAAHALAAQALSADQVKTIHTALAAHFPQA
ncbi:MAG: nuclease-related domain-containing protein [Jatrophihabitantaceae bacterium]